MKKTSVYLDEEHVERLRRTAEAEGRSQAEVLRDAIIMYTSRSAQRRPFALTGVAASAGQPVADLPEEELLRGFGE
jgi:hypothetical protein